MHLSNNDFKLPTNACDKSLYQTIDSTQMKTGSIGHMHCCLCVTSTQTPDSAFYQEAYKIVSQPQSNNQIIYNSCGDAMSHKN